MNCPRDTLCVSSRSTGHRHAYEFRLFRVGEQHSRRGIRPLTKACATSFRSLDSIGVLGMSHWAIALVTLASQGLVPLRMS